jgi:hypothetical protein
MPTDTSSNPSADNAAAPDTDTDIDMLSAARKAFPREIARMEARYALVLSGDA